ncbi:unnamed protein product [Effrenium voratum]|uniref:Uncharacterized protein n=1 Tax=Effrenium voratum TaxID=2562239 RepID=A0AA36I3U3_9DINO|nr:unnamed protein product [Effrenium voratum]CAJ1379615.1 unnamed protein product [Effrenium voratum]CAJ1437576.1 unnamed protein product [Effrenium voratum]
MARGPRHGSDGEKAHTLAASSHEGRRSCPDSVSCTLPRSAIFLVPRKLRRSLASQAEPQDGFLWPRGKCSTLVQGISEHCAVATTMASRPFFAQKHARARVTCAVIQDMAQPRFIGQD